MPWIDWRIAGPVLAFAAFLAFEHYHFASLPCEREEWRAVMVDPTRGSPDVVKRYRVCK